MLSRCFWPTFLGVHGFFAVSAHLAKRPAEHLLAAEPLKTPVSWEKQ